MMNKLKWATCLMISTILLAGSSFAQEEDSRADRLEKELKKYKQKVDQLKSEKNALTANRRDLNDARTLSTSNRTQNSQRGLTAPRFPQPVAAINPFGQSATGFTVAGPGLSSFGVGSSSFFGRRDPRLAEAYNEANKKLAELVKEIKSADGEEAKLKLKEDVRVLLEEKYDAYLEHHEAPLVELEERLEKLRAEFEQRKKAKDDLVKLRLDTVWYDALGLGWPDNQRGASIWPVNVTRAPRLLNDTRSNLTAPAVPRANRTEPRRSK